MSLKLPPQGSTDTGILERLLRLENAVFGSEATFCQTTTPDSFSSNGNPMSQRSQGEAHLTKGRTSQLQTSIAYESTPSSSASTQHPEDDEVYEKREVARMLDLGLTSGLGQSECSRLTFNGQTSVIHQRPDLTVLPIRASQAKIGKWIQDSTAQVRSITLMTRDEAFSLLVDFTSHIIQLLPILHGPDVRSVISQLYNNLSEGDHLSPHNLGYASLILAIAATSAFFYHSESNISSMFEAPEQAAKASMVWLRASLDLLDQSQREACTYLEDVQARVILSYLTYNIEGCSSRFRMLQSSAVSLGRDIGLHLIDSPNFRSGQRDSISTKEMKRRLWWYIVSTDWYVHILLLLYSICSSLVTFAQITRMLGFMGGPLEGTYSVQPRQMNVSPVRNINNGDLETQNEVFSRPYNVPTDVSFLIQRVRLGEACRKAIDARSPGAPEEDITDADQVLTLDRIFEQVLAELPPFFRPRTTAHDDDEPKPLRLQRDTILLAIYSRRARINRPFILNNNPADETHQILRKNCLSSTRMAVSIATDMLESSRFAETRHQNPILGTLSRRMGGIIIGHLFAVCAILALNAGCRRRDQRQVSPKPGQSPMSLSGAVDEDKDLSKACRVLTAVGEESPVAASLLRTLTGVLRQYRVQGPTGLLNRGDSICPDDVLESTAPLGTYGDPVSRSSVLNSVDRVTSTEDLGLAPFWSEVIDSGPDTASWDDLFAGLDVYFGPSSSSM